MAAVKRLTLDRLVKANPYRERADALAVLGFESYDSYLRSALWKAIRRQALAKGARCCRCLRTSRTFGPSATLQVHHTIYNLKTLSGADTQGLVVVCQKCHAKAERPTVKRQGHERLRRANAFIATTPSLLERCWVWYEQNQRWERSVSTPDAALALVEVYRQRANDGQCCLVCGGHPVGPHAEHGLERRSESSRRWRS
jgi:hypothetical protein